jgi:hypothetical protein
MDINVAELDHQCQAHCVCLNETGTTAANKVNKSMSCQSGVRYALKQRFNQNEIRSGTYLCSKCLQCPDQRNMCHLEAALNIIAGTCF